MGLYKHFKKFKDKEETQYNECSFKFKFLPNLSIEKEQEYGIQDYILVRLEWLIWSYTIYYKSKLNKNYE